MSIIRAEVTDIIDARPEDVYAVIADYHTGHPAILPKPEFTDLTVEEGGRGAGTVIRFGMNVMGRTREFRAVVSEPEPGRVLVETYPESASKTTFTVEPLAGGQQSKVTIATDQPASPGLMGMIEKLTTPPFLRNIYKKELRQLAEVLRSRGNPTSRV